ncbi:MAG: hypothetical protein JOZ05_16780 [Acetobacteraceae bacterium]|nr:hypothetical protein [Acetobacteraceae bacterium]
MNSLFGSANRAHSPAIIRTDEVECIPKRGQPAAVWRRLEVSLTATLADLHVAIQAAMGWEDLHLHCFRIFGRRYDSEYGLRAGPLRVESLIGFERRGLM